MARRGTAQLCFGCGGMPACLALRWGEPLHGTTVAPGKSGRPPFEGVELIEVLWRIPSLEVSGASAIELY
jgi:hypothetical protein